MTFLVPFLIFGLGAIGILLIQQRFDDDSSGMRAYGYLLVLVNMLAFFSPFVLQVIFRSRYHAHKAMRGGS